MASRKVKGQGEKRRSANKNPQPYQRGDGRWTVSVDLGIVNGKRARKQLYGKTADEVVEKMRDVQMQVRRGESPADDRTTVKSFLTRWVATLEDTVKPSTADGYDRIVRLYILPAIGHKKLAGLQPADVQQMLDDLAERGLSPRTRQYARAVLRRALRRAEQWGEVPRNVAALVDGPRGGSKKGRTLEPEQAVALLDAARGHRLEAFVAVGIGCGLRRGEILGLRWDDVDLEDGVLHVRNNLQRLRGELVLLTPKTRMSERSVEMPAVLVTVLRAHRARQAADRLKAGAAWHDTGHVLTTSIGTPMDPDRVRHEFSALTKSAGLGHWTPKELRHSAASLLLAQGVPLEVVSEILGHSSIRITKDVYAHLLRPAKKGAAAAMDALLTGSTK